MGIEHFLAYYCAPALAGIKPANIAAYRKSQNPYILSEIKELNSILNKKDIYIEILCECKERILIMLYRRRQLCEYLNTPQIKNLLETYGYPKHFSLYEYFEILRKRTVSGCSGIDEFPHEIGAFLGYPIHDIYGFINHRDKHCLLTGEWKVYADADNAKKMFCRYSDCRRAVVKRLNEGKTLEELFCTA
ncbi:DUF3793 family protein [Lachnospiraceae bacterium MD329]|nr:DUF3793 family protein [Lachnospiraceae bacterium MD329]